MKKQENLEKNCDLELLKVGISDNANLLNDDELSELFGGYSCDVYCPNGYCKGYIAEPEPEPMDPENLYV